MLVWAVKFYKTILIVVVSIVIILKICNINKSLKNQVELTTQKSLQSMHLNLTHDTNKYLSMENVHYILDNKKCAAGIVLVLVSSHSAHEQLRQWHRHDVSQQALSLLNFRRIFLIFKDDEQLHSKKFITREQEAYGDLLQGNMQETQDNHIFKQLMGLQWAVEKCSNVKFIVHMRDDVNINVLQLQSYLFNLHNQHVELAKSHSFLSGNVFRAESNIDHINTIDFVKDWFYITNTKTASCLVYEAQRTPFYGDMATDVWLTGLVPQRLHIKLRMLHFMIDVNNEYTSCCIMSPIDRTTFNMNFQSPLEVDDESFIKNLENQAYCPIKKCVSKYPAFDIFL